VTAFEELQLGVGDEAQVYDIDVTGTVTPNTEATVFEPPAPPSSYCE